jgi:predicted transcriptional regulator
MEPPIPTIDRILDQLEEAARSDVERLMKQEKLTEQEAYSKALGIILQRRRWRNRLTGRERDVHEAMLAIFRRTHEPMTKGQIIFQLTAMQKDASCSDSTFWRTLKKLASKFLIEQVGGSGSPLWRPIVDNETADQKTSKRGRKRAA